jgi:hypothetical protein
MASPKQKSLASKPTLATYVYREESQFHCTPKAAFGKRPPPVNNPVAMQRRAVADRITQGQTTMSQK